MTKQKEYWQINIEKIVKDIKDASIKATTEEDLKMAVEPILQEAFKKIGIDIDIVKYETATGYRGKMDAVYGYLIIEYKVPGKLSSKTDIKKTYEQIQKYLTDYSSQFGDQRDEYLEKAVGVAIDGESLLFVRFTKTPTILQTPIPIEFPQKELFPEIEVTRGFHVQGPYPINIQSISNLLIFVRASARRPLTAKDLAGVFAPSCQVTQQTVSEFYSEVMRSQRKQVPSKIKTFFSEWDRIFGIVYGQELEKADKSAENTAKLFNLPAGVRLKQLLFSIHTFYAFLMKLIAIELISLQRGSITVSFAKELSSLDNDELKDKLIYLENGADFINQGIENFLEADFFGWYIDAWSPKIANAVRSIIRSISEFEPATPILEPEWTKDLLQKLYEIIVPQELRHDLGEYYTPDWLAGYVVDKSGYNGDLSKRFLDPACGSGTFLVQAINRVIIRNVEKNKKINMQEVAQHILNNVVGFDINPLAVLTARTNYLIAFSKFISYVRPIVIPVYLCDSICGPEQTMEEGELKLENTIVFRTTKYDYKFPVSINSKDYIDKFTSKVDIALKGKITPELFKNQIEKEFNLNEEDIKLLTDIYTQIKKLDDSGENGIWAKYIKNAFAPIYLGKFDFVIGNPPWVRWVFLSDDYRKRTLNLWHKYGLFSLKGYETRLGGGEKDFSMLFTYSCADNYLKDNGILGFVITIEVFKSKGAGEGFRQFELKNKRIPLKVLSMEDMVDVKPFTAANKTSIFFLKKNEKTIYPVEVIEWKRKKGTGSINPELILDEVLSKTQRKKIQAIPIDKDKYTSSWQTASSSELKIFSQLKGKNPYKAYCGLYGTPYGVFRLQLKEIRPDGILVIQNMYERGKLEIKSVTTSIESDLIFPSICGGDIIKFGVKSHFYMLISQDPKKRCGYDENYLSTKYPLTYAYLVKFKDVLSKRAIYIKHYFKEIKENGKVVSRIPIAPFYSQYNISEETFLKYRITWNRMASKMSAVVLSSIKTEFGNKLIIPTDPTAFTPTDNKDEAHYLCSILNSEIVNDFISSFSQAGRGFGTPSVMENLVIPKFDSKDKIHIKLSELSENAHNSVKRGSDINDIEKEINEVVKKLWNIKS